MSKETRQGANRRAFIARTGGLAASALVGASPAVWAQTTSAGAPPRDLGLWVTWYDLPEAGRKEHLSWLHDRYLPALLKRPGYLWAAHYATVVGRTMTAREQSLAHAADGAVPAGECMRWWSAVSTPTDSRPRNCARRCPGRPQDARQRRGAGECFAETGRGRQAKITGGMALAPCIQLGSFNVDYQKEEEVLAWYAQSRLPAMTSLPGCIRTRKLASVAGWAKEGILYEFISLEARNKYFPTFEDPHPEMKEWSSRVVKHLLHAPGSPNLAQRIWPAV